MNITFCELKTKDVINVTDGKKLGRVVDLVFCCNGCRVLGIVVPNERHFFRCKDDTFIPWSNIQKIGADCILVNLAPQPAQYTNGGGKKKSDCDYIIDDDY